MIGEGIQVDTFSVFLVIVTLIGFQFVFAQPKEKKEAQTEEIQPPTKPEKALNPLFPRKVQEKWMMKDVEFFNWVIKRLNIHFIEEARVKQPMLLRLNEERKQVLEEILRYLNQYNFKDDPYKWKYALELANVSKDYNADDYKVDNMYDKNGNDTLFYHVVLYQPCVKID